MLKELIKKRFEKSLKTYDTSAVVQKHMAEELIGMSDYKDYENVLELGCGTGFLTKLVNKNIGFKKFCVVDMVGGCDDYIKKISPEIEFVEGDIENYKPCFTPNLVVSNASLQWTDNLAGFLDEVYGYLADGGEFIFSVFGNGNFEEFDAFIESSMSYYTVDEIKNMCSKYSFSEIKEDVKILEFNSPLEVLYHIKNTGVNALSKTRWMKSDLLNFENNYPKSQNGKYRLTYRPVYVKLKK